MKKCIYCNELKPLSDFNHEHIFPESLGGKSCGSIFKTRSVCTRCNSFCGLWVDGAFLKDSIVKNFKAIDDFKYVDFENGSVHSLSYMGRIETNLTEENESCELWLGPCSDMIFHFHTNLDEKFFSYTGGNPISYKSNPGRVFFFTGTNNDKWFKIALLSFYNHFKKAKRYSGNAKIKDIKEHQKYFNNPGEKEEHIMKELVKIISPSFDTKASGKFNIEQAFFSKIALGLGYNLLGSGFLKTHHVKKLRENIFNSAPDCKNEFHKVSSPFFKSDTELNDMLAWEGGHTFIFYSTGKNLTLLFSLNGQHLFQIMISDTPNLWINKSELIEGQVYILIPQRALFCGPFRYPEYISYINNNFEIAQLSRLKSLVVRRSDLPPFWLKDDSIEQ